jgi:hypothetical protein
LPSAALGKAFAECNRGFAECPKHSAKSPSAVVIYTDSLTLMQPCPNATLHINSTNMMSDLEL